MGIDWHNIRLFYIRIQTRNTGSLMNVAVSRAKDHFFLFGDLNCLKDVQNSASGLLKKCVGAAELAV